MVLCTSIDYMGVDMGSTVVTDWANTWIRSFRYVNGEFCRTTRLLKCKDGFSNLRILYLDPQNQIRFLLR